MLSTPAVPSGCKFNVKIAGVAVYVAVGVLDGVGVAVSVAVAVAVNVGVDEGVAVKVAVGEAVTVEVGGVGRCFCQWTKTSASPFVSAVTRLVANE